MELQDYLKLYPNTSACDRIKTHSFPKLANQVQGTPLMNTTVWNRLYLYDLIVCDIDLYDSTAPNYNGIVAADYLGRFGKIRANNPNAVILGYFSAGDVKIANNCMSFSNTFAKGFDPSWYMRDKAGGIVKLFYLPAPTNMWTSMQNVTTPVNSYIPTLIKNLVLPSGNMDGVFYDWMNSRINWLNTRTPQPPAPGDQGLDINNDGVQETGAQLDAAWLAGFRTLLANTRMMLPNDFLIMGNIGWGYDPPDFENNVNGAMIEQFQIAGTPPWKQQVRNYYRYCTFGPKPKTAFIMGVDNDPNNFNMMRYGLASALMFDGYFCFTRNGGYLDARWYDEYAVNLNTGVANENVDLKGWLGAPLGPSFNVANSSELLSVNLDGVFDADNKVWRRDFENGIALVNPSTNLVTVNLGGTFRKIKGKVDPTFNNGTTLTSIDMPPKSGAVLMR
jgi:hypothetical protein